MRLGAAAFGIGSAFPPSALRRGSHSALFGIRRSAFGILLMAQGSRPARVGDQIRQELTELLARELRDPGVGFITITEVKVSPDLQVARAYYTTMGDEEARRETRKALDRATPFLRREIGHRLRLRRVPELHFHFDQSVERGDRIERILQDLHRTKPTDDE